MNEGNVLDTHNGKVFSQKKETNRKELYATGKMDETRNHCVE